MSNLIKQISSTVRYLRNQKGLSQAKLAEMSGVHEKTIISVESGKHTMKIDVLEKISKAFGLETYELLLPPKSVINTRMQLDVRQELINAQDSIGRVLKTVVDR